MTVLVNMYNLLRFSNSTLNGAEGGTGKTGTGHYQLKAVGALLQLVVPVVNISTA